MTAMLREATFRLPFISAHAFPDGAARGALASLPTMRILLAEDEHALGEWLSKALEQSGFRVDWVDDGGLAERALADHDYDALVLDLGLPGQGGHQLLQKLRAQDRRLPVLILTARDSLAERVSTLNEGADDFLAKPF